MARRGGRGRISTHRNTIAGRYPGSIHGPSIKNPATYEALRRQGKSKSVAAAISNAALDKGYKYGVHGRKRSGGRRSHK